MSTEDNKAVMRRYLEEFHSRRQIELANEILGSNLREPTLGLARTLLTAFPDYHLTVLDQVAEGDKVATISEGRGTHSGTWESPLGPIPATGKQVTWTGTTTVQIRDSQIADVIGSAWDH